MEVYDQELDQAEPFKGVILATCFAIRSIVHTITQYTPMNLVFGDNAILNIAHKANWKLIKDKKQDLNVGDRVSG